MSTGVQRGLVVVVVVLTLALALVAAGLVAVQRQTSALRADVARLQGELDRAEEEVARLDREAQESSGLLEGLLGGGDLGGLDLEGLDLEGLDLEGLLDGLLEGGGLEGLEDLGGLFGGSSTGGSDLLGCVTGDGRGGLGGLGGLGGGQAVTADDVTGQVAEITDRVEELRGLEQLEPIEPTYMTTPEIESRVTELTLDEYPADEADLDRRVLAALGAVPPDTDLRALAAELVSGQVAGFYDTQTGELVVRTDDPDQPLDPVGQITLAHELQHAIADQNLELDLDDPDQPTDAARAGLALIEGDATLTMQRFSLEAVPLDQQLALAGDPAVTASQDQLAAFPHYLQRDLLFPYSDGLALVCDLEAEGGWAAVDRAYDRRPQTTVEVMFPDRYGQPAAEPRAPGAAGEGWTQARTDSFGAADLRWLFEAPGDDVGAALDDPLGRAGAWTGGRLTLSTRDGDSALGVALVGGGEGPALCGSVTDWYRAAFPDAREATAPDAELALDGEAQDAVVRCDGDEVRLGIAPDLDTALDLTG